MSEYINNLKINSNVNIQKENNNVSFQGIRTKDKKQDTFEKDKYKELKIRAGVFATGVAIWKRKEIGNIFERGWNKLKNIFSKGDAEETAKTAENIKPETPKPTQKPEDIKPVIKLTPTEQLTKELAEIQKQIDPNVDTSKMKFGDILDLIDKEKETGNVSLDIRKQVASMRKKAVEQNVSFIPTVKITPDMSEKEIVDSVSHVEWYMNKNEASCLEGLEWIKQNGHYAKDIDYGKYASMTTTFLDEVTVNLRTDRIEESKYVTDKVLNKYMEVYNLYQKSWDSAEGFKYSDAAHLGILFREYSDRMSKETAFKFLEAGEKTARTREAIYDFQLYADGLKIGEQSRKEFIKRAETLHSKLPKFQNPNSKKKVK